MRYALLGYGVSGRGAEKLLKSKNIHGPDIFDDTIQSYPSVSSCDFERYDKVIVSPGITPDKINIPANKVTSEVEIAYETLLPDAKIVGITGTNGKSTITYLTWQILKQLGADAVYCGNIGRTFSEVVAENNYNIYVVELSSYQIDLLKNFRMDAFCICNVTPDHLDRYRDMKRYTASKLAALKFVDAEKSYLLKSTVFEDFNISKSINFIDPELKKFPVIKNNILDFGRFYADIGSYSLPGRHNILNLAFAMCLADEVYGLKGDVSSVVFSLQSLEHRCEKFAESKEVQYINDSKSTNPESTMTALNALNGNVILLMGGRIKNADYTGMTKLINKLVKKLILFGEAADSLNRQFEANVDVETQICAGLAEAVDYALLSAEAGDTVLLSPGCSSFDCFSNFEERGKYFKDAVNKKLKGCGLNA
ncbi:MAG: UDP-N-acetylmuramoyl-L-alanine--D-glutamate ligase [Flexistipes sinusarabici]|uniref:UDP-N-acetylmuramoylalanine--D-glutamate ligase n=1 Tax=Flexistipes sinusarabici TaxID=2352 RepID=A0A5D0MQL5_FLESI|nr:UDP-N-acetylmuramoyl-L-alanine--D-glutamate ligase [Flexistipes sinusarabici]TYB33980.1 MAG: UDP-N-acetylmuramoyl-L-alanine--D-glutamate ligase [Flexistipes sinusarabici]